MQNMHTQHHTSMVLDCMFGQHDVLSSIQKFTHEKKYKTCTLLTQEYFKNAKEKGSWPDQLQQKS